MEGLGEANKKAATGNQKAMGRVRVLVLPITKQDAQGGEVKPAGSTTDDLGAMVAKGEIVEPPFDLLVLSMLNEHSTELNQCIEAMEINIDGFGHRFIPRVDMDKNPPDGLKNEVNQERIRLENFFAYASIEDSFTMTRRKIRKDLELNGNGCMEVVRGLDGKIQGLNHVPSYQVRLTPVEEQPFEVEVPLLELQQDGSIKVVKVKTWKRFRRYVQSKQTQLRSLGWVGSSAKRWYKEFGDPRVYDCTTGELAQAPLDVTKRATELVHFRNYAPRTPYGVPRYIGNLLSIFGDRASEEINFTTFKNNNIPSMMIAVSNGMLTQASIDRIKEFVESQIQGSDNYSKFLILEGESSYEGEDGGQVKIDVKPLVALQHTDALFQQYSQNNQDKIRRAFRLPPIFVGRSDDYTRATAESSRVLADEQVFAPERDEFDAWMNRRLFPEMGIVYHKYKSNSPNVTDNTSLISIMSGAERSGGMTPRTARMILEAVLGQDLPSMDASVPLDIPFSMTMAEAVKNMAMPNEVGQQVTAMKHAITNPFDAVQRLIDLRLGLINELEGGAGGEAEGGKK